MGASDDEAPVSPQSTDPRLAELREHVALNFTTDARAAIAWALERIVWYQAYVQAADNEVKRAGERKRQWELEPPHCATCSCEPLPAQFLRAPCGPDDHMYSAIAGSEIGTGVCVFCGAPEPADDVGGGT